MNFKKAEKLLKDIDQKIKKWDERSCFTLKGVKNLSRSDLETLQLYAETFLKDWNLDSLMPLRGNLKTVWDKYAEAA